MSNESDPKEVEAFKEYKTAVVEPLKNVVEDGKIEIWGVNIMENGELASSPKVDTILLKFLRASELDVKLAVERIIVTLQWRKEFRVEDLKNETFDTEFSKVGYIHKIMENGTPVSYNVYGAVPADRIFHDTQRFLRWRIKLMEENIRRLDFEKVTGTLQIHDYANVNMFSLDKATKATVKETVKIFQDHYPELLERKFFINVPWFMAGVFNVVRMLVNSRTQDKFQMCSDDYREVLLRSIPAENLPVHYGGLSRMEEDLKNSEAFQKLDQVKATHKKIPSRENYKTEIEIPPKSDIHWEFVLADKDIKFIATVITEGEEKILVDEMVKADQGVKNGSHTTSDKSARLTLQWKNDFSVFTSKDVYHRHVIIQE